MKLLIMCFLPALAWSQQAGIEGPSLGWVWDEPHARLRPVRGIAGSSTLGNVGSQPAAAALKFAAASPEGFAVGIAEDGRLYRQLAGVWTMIDAPQGAMRMVLSDSGGAALVLYEDGTARVLTGLPDQPKMGETPAALAGASSLAISRDGSVMLSARPDERTVCVSSGAGHQWKLDLEQEVRSAALLPGGVGQDALLASGGGVWLIRDVAGNAAKRLLWDQPADAVAVVGMGRVAIAVASGGRSLILVDLETGKAQQIPTPARATTLARMTRDDVFRLTSASEGPIWMIDLSQTEPRFFFVPAAGE